MNPKVYLVLILLVISTIACKQPDPDPAQQIQRHGLNCSTETRHACNNNP